ncbi:MAG: hypothetical protein WCR06_03845 [bacterium]
MKIAGQGWALFVFGVVLTTAYGWAVDEGDIVVNPPGKKAPVDAEVKPASTNTTGKLKAPKMTLAQVKTAPKAMLSYGYEIKTTDAQVRKPLVVSYFVVQSQDGTKEYSKLHDRKGSLAERSEIFDYDIMKTYSKKEAYVPAKDVRAVTTHFEEIPWLEKKGHLQVVLFRFELWVDGVLLDSYDSKPSTLWQQMKIPSDWYQRDSQHATF